MTATFLGNGSEVHVLFTLRHLVPGEDLGVGSATGNLLSWPDLQEGERYLVGKQAFSLDESFYTVETIHDVNGLIARWSDIPYGRLRIYVATRR